MREFKPKVFFGTLLFFAVMTGLTLGIAWLYPLYPDIIMGAIVFIAILTTSLIVAYQK